MKHKLITTIITLLLIGSAAANAQTYFEDTVWTKKTDQASGFYQVKFSNNDSIIVGHGYENAIFYNAFDGEEIARLPFNAEVHFIDNDNKYLQLSSDERNIVIYDTKTLVPLDTIDNDGLTIGRYDITSDEKYIVGVVTNGLRIWNLEAGTMINTRLFDGETGLTGWSARQIKVLCNDLDFLLLEAKTYYNPDDPDKPLIRGYQKKYSIMTLDSLDIYNNSRSFSVSKNCQYLAYKTGDKYEGVEIYDFNTKQLMHKLPINGPSLTGIEFSTDDKYVVTSVGLTHRSLKIWDVLSGNGVYEYNDGGYENFDVSHSGNHIISSIGRYLLFYPFKSSTSLLINEYTSELIYPNPATGEVNIDLSNHTLKDVVESVRVYDMQGMKVLSLGDSPFQGNDMRDSEGKVKISVSSLPNGEYIIELRSKNNSRSYKLIINK